MIGKVIDLSEVTAKSFQLEKNAVFLMATHYQGDPPDNAADFWSWFSKKSNHKEGWLSDMKFTVFALGNTNYEMTFAKIGQ